MWACKQYSGAAITSRESVEQRTSISSGESLGALFVCATGTWWQRTQEVVWGVGWEWLACPYGWRWYERWHATKGGGAWTLAWEVAMIAEESNQAVLCFR